MQADTSYIVWSYHSQDPTGPNTIPRHEFQGSVTLNLLGGLTEDREEPPDTDSFTIAVENVSIVMPCTKLLAHALFMKIERMQLLYCTPTTLYILYCVYVCI